jgi:site-specific recombinase XerD
LLNQVLVRAGILKVGTRRGGTTSHAWTTLIGSLRSHDAIQNLSTLGKFCSKQGIEPRDVTLDVWHELVDETLNCSTFKNPRATLQKTLRTSNAARRTILDWPLPEFPGFANPRSWSIPRDLLPSPFWADINTYVEVSGKPAKNVFDKTAAKQLRPATLVRYREVAWRTASAQVRAGRNPGDIVSLAALLDIQWLKEGLNWQRKRAGDKFLKDHLNMAATWLSMADNYVRPGKDVRDAIREDIFDVIDDELGPADFSERNMKKLDQFSNPEIVSEFLYLPYQIMSEIKKKKVITIGDATEMMAAAAIDLLLATMIRRKNLANLDLSKHFWPASPSQSGKWHVLIEREEVKNSQPLRLPLQKQTIALLDFYMKKCRPLLKGKPTDMLFLRTNGSEKGLCMVADLVKRTIRRRLDLDVNIHLFRHIGTMIYLEAHPGDFGVPRVMLGHKSQTTTEKFYACLCATKAIEHFTKVVLGERNARLTKLKIA